MFEPEDLPRLRDAIRQRAQSDRSILEELRNEVRSLKPEVRPIHPRSTTAVSLVASDGGNNQLVFDPFHVQLVRVVDSYGKQLFLDTVSPTTDPDQLCDAQFHADGAPKTPLGRMMADFNVQPRSLHGLSPMLPEGRKVRENPEQVSPSWVLVYRDLCEWAVLYERICYDTFATDTLIVRDGLLRSKLFAKDYFIQYRKRIEAAIQDIHEKDRRKVFLVGIAKHSKVLTRYNLALAIEGILPSGEARYVRIPRILEAKAYVWPEYARGAETEGEGEAPKFVAGDMFFVRFGKHSGDPIWTIDVFSMHGDKANEIFGYLLADAIAGFPIPFYPRCLQKAHEYAQIVDFDLDLLQDEILAAVRDLLSQDEKPILDAMQLTSDFAGRRYQ
jgi:hypothetical protein